MKDRIRVSFTTNRDTWAYVNDQLKEKGYPQGTLAHYLTLEVENLSLQLQFTDGNQLKLLLDRE